MTPSLALQYLSALGAIAAFSAYAWGYIMKPKGDRRIHVAALLFSSIALACLPIIIPSVTGGAGFFASACVVFFMICATACQAFTAFRGRAGDRVGSAADRREGVAAAK